MKAEVSNPEDSVAVQNRIKRLKLEHQEDLSRLYENDASTYVNEIVDRDASKPGVSSDTSLEKYLQVSSWQLILLARYLYLFLACIYRGAQGCSYRIGVVKQLWTNSIRLPLTIHPPEEATIRSGEARSDNAQETRAIFSTIKGGFLQQTSRCQNSGFEVSHRRLFQARKDDEWIWLGAQASQTFARYFQTRRTLFLRFIFSNVNQDLQKEFNAEVRGIIISATTETRDPRKP